ncbi:MAG: hypothetical protein GWN00_29735, partial [Aliifodinibius sp.]|nr:hypothetical protein [Fodinibius sp.]NIY28821.1 hypothetical protein [Fodinibius sp.]
DTVFAGTSQDLIWEFDIPSPANTGNVRVNANLSFNNGTIDTTVTTTFLINSGVSLAYRQNSILPKQVVPGQIVAFSAIIENSGNTDLLVNPDSSYLG